MWLENRLLFGEMVKELSKKTDLFRSKKALHRKGCALMFRCFVLWAVNVEQSDGHGGLINMEIIPSIVGRLVCLSVLGNDILWLDCWFSWQGVKEVKQVY